MKTPELSFAHVGTLLDRLHHRPIWVRLVEVVVIAAIVALGP